MENQKQQIIDRLKQANNVLVTVSNNPSVDQLAAAIGLTLALNKLNKHAIAVFSGEVPSTIEFLKPEETFEKNTDSLRDFIISLDKAKADKLRYKVEDQLVKIFITPYRTSLSDKDLEFSQGDFNVEVVVALGVKEQQDLDQAITAQGRILHDATVIDISTDGETKLGTLIWSNPKASSLCEMILSLVEPMKPGILDAQTATSLLTGIVAETLRFSNEKTSPETMQASSKLMAAGANQQLVALQLEPVPEEPPVELPDPVEETPPVAEAPVEETPEPEPEPEPEEKVDGELEVDHEEENEESDESEENETPTEPEDELEPEISQIHIDEHGKIRHPNEKEEVTAPSATPGRGLALEPPTLGGKLTANTEPEHLDPPNDILGSGVAEKNAPLLSHEEKIDVPDANVGVQNDTQTLASLEEAVGSPHLDQARNAVDQAKVESPPPPNILDKMAPSQVESKHSLLPPDPGLPKDETGPDVFDPAPPPPVPPPMMPPSFAQPPSNTNTNSDQNAPL